MMSDPESLLTCWKLFNISEKKEQLILITRDIERASSSQKETRKQIGEKLTKFRDFTQEEKLSSIGDIISSFKAEFDNSSQSILSIQKLIAQFATSFLDLPDPTELFSSISLASSRKDSELLKLQQEIESLRIGQSSSDELERLRKDNAQLESELLKVSNQDITIRRLNEEINALTMKMDEEVTSRLMEMESEMRQTFDEQLEHFREAETAAEARLSTTRSQLNEAISAKNHAQSALGHLRNVHATEISQKDAEIKTLQHQISLLKEDLSRLGTNKRGKLKLSSMAEADIADNSEANDPGSELALQTLRAQNEVYRYRAETAENELSSLESQLHQARRELESASLAYQTVQSALTALQAEFSQLTQDYRALSGSGATASALEVAISQDSQAREASEIESLRRELKYLKAALYGSLEQDDFTRDTSEAADARSSSSFPKNVRFLPTSVSENERTEGEGTKGDLDRERGSQSGDDSAVGLIIRRSKLLESRLLAAQESLLELRTRLSARDAELEAVQAQRSELSLRVAELENAIAGSPVSREGHLPSAGTAEQPLPPDSITISLSQALSPPWNPTPQSSHFLVNGPPREVGGSVDDTNVLAVLRVQRDRLRVRVGELESQLEDSALKLGESERKSSQLSADNVRMYEKIRYLQSLVAGASNSLGDLEANISGGARSRAGRAGFNLVDEDEFESNYRDDYNKSMNPFNKFIKQQRASQYKMLSAADKVALTSSNVLSGSKFARNFLFVYLIFLHMLVFITLNHFSSVSHECKKDNI